LLKGKLSLGGGKHALLRRRSLAKKGNRKKKVSGGLYKGGKNKRKADGSYQRGSRR